MKTFADLLKLTRVLKIWSQRDENRLSEYHYLASPIIIILRGFYIDLSAIRRIVVNNNNKNTHIRIYFVDYLEYRCRPFFKFKFFFLFYSRAHNLCFEDFNFCLWYNDRWVELGTFFKKFSISINIPKIYRDLDRQWTFCITLIKLYVSEEKIVTASLRQKVYSDKNAFFNLSHFNLLSTLLISSKKNNFTFS